VQVKADVLIFVELHAFHKNKNKTKISKEMPTAAEYIRCLSEKKICTLNVLDTLS